MDRGINERDLQSKNRSIRPDIEVRAALGSAVRKPGTNVRAQPLRAQKQQSLHHRALVGWVGAMSQARKRGVLI